MGNGLNTPVESYILTEFVNGIRQQKYTDSNGNSDDMDGSSFSSFYSSFIKTTDGSESPPDNDKEPKHRKLKVNQIQLH